MKTGRPDENPRLTVLDIRQGEEMNPHDAAAPSGETVIMLHAAVVSRHELLLLARRLRRRGFEVHCPGYPNRRLSVPDCAEYLLPLFREISAGTAGRVHLAGHSMGGLVARRLIHLYQPPNLGRLATLGTPHLGSPLADALHGYAFYQKLFGPAGQDLVTGRPLDWLAPWPPPVEIGLIAGSLPIGPGSFHLPRPCDGTVPQASSQPPGGTDYALVPATHTTIPFLKKTAELVAGFFRTGRFMPPASS